MTVGDGLPTIERVVAVVDCGTIVDPDTARQQVEGSVVMGLSAAMREEITIQNGAVVEQSFRDYPIFTLADTPRISTSSGERGPWGGMGEPALPPAAPALANAIFAATGRRIRTCPSARIPAGSRFMSADTLTFVQAWMSIRCASPRSSPRAPGSLG